MYKKLPQSFPKALVWLSGHTPTLLGAVEASQHHRNTLIINPWVLIHGKEFMTNQFNRNLHCVTRWSFWPDLADVICERGKAARRVKWPNIDGHYVFIGMLLKQNHSYNSQNKGAVSFCSLFKQNLLSCPNFFYCAWVFVFNLLKNTTPSTNKHSHIQANLVKNSY